MIIAIDQATDLMPQTESPAEASLPAADTHAAERSNSLRYCLLLVLLPLLAIPAFIALGSSDFFLHHGASVWVQVQRRRLRHARPRLRRPRLRRLHRHDRHQPGRRRSATPASRPATSPSPTPFWPSPTTSPSTTSWRTTRAPRPPVQLSPDGFQPENHAWHRPSTPKACWSCFATARRSEARHVLLTHPQESIAFAGYAAGFSAYYAIKDVWFHVTHLRPEEDTVTVRNGFFTPPVAAPHLLRPRAPPPSTDPSRRRLPPLAGRQFRNDYADRCRHRPGQRRPHPLLRSEPRRLQLASSTASPATPSFPSPSASSTTAATTPPSARTSSPASSPRNSTTVASRNPQIDDRIPASRRVATLRTVRLHRVRKISQRSQHPIQLERLQRASFWRSADPRIFAIRPSKLIASPATATTHP